VAKQGVPTSAFSAAALACASACTRLRSASRTAAALEAAELSPAAYARCSAAYMARGHSNARYQNGLLGRIL
jgi:hypothetical protein